MRTTTSSSSSTTTAAPATRLAVQLLRLQRHERGSGGVKGQEWVCTAVPRGVRATRYNLCELR
jgi:hypothetical protein